MTESSAQALSILRDPSQFQWYIIPFLLVVIYVYHNEVRLKNWNAVFAGLALWGCDWFNEIWNALVFHFTQYAPVWGAPGKTAYLILIGLNIEISLMFLLMGVACSIILPEDRKLKILGMPNRLFYAIILHHAGRDRGNPPECHRRPDLGLLVVECEKPLAYLADRILLFLCRGLPRVRYENDQVQGDHRRSHL